MEHDPVNHPPHYTQSPVECIEVIEYVTFGYPPEIRYHIGNVIKYLWRAPLKNNLEQDLRKAVWYMERAINHQNKTRETG